MSVPSLPRHKLTGVCPPARGAVLAELVRTRPAPVWLVVAENLRIAEQLAEDIAFFHGATGGVGGALQTLVFPEAMAEGADMREVLKSESSPEDARRMKIGLARMLSATSESDEAHKLVDEVLAEDSGAAEALKLKATWQIQEDQIGNKVPAERHRKVVSEALRAHGSKSEGTEHNHREIRRVDSPHALGRIGS